MSDVGLHELDWVDVAEPGCYLMIASGLLARVYQEDLDAAGKSPRAGAGTRVVRLSSNPRALVEVLRAVAFESHYTVNF
jgi:hypothetical protein